MATLSELRNQHNLTQKGLAEKLGVSVAAISSWERGVTPIQQKYADDLCRILAMKSDDFHTLRQDTLAHAKIHKARRGAPKTRKTAKTAAASKSASTTKSAQASGTTTEAPLAKTSTQTAAAQATKVLRKDQPVIKSQAEFDNEKKARAKHFSNHQASLTKSLDLMGKQASGEGKSEAKGEAKGEAVGEPSGKATGKATVQAKGKRSVKAVSSEKGKGDAPTEVKSETKKTDKAKEKAGTQPLVIGNFERLKRGKHRHGTQAAETDLAKAMKAHGKAGQAAKGPGKSGEAQKGKADSKFSFLMKGIGMKPASPAEAKEIKSAGQVEHRHPEHLVHPEQGEPQEKLQAKHQERPQEKTQERLQERSQERPLEGQDYKSLENLFQEAFEGYQQKKQLTAKVKNPKAGRSYQDPRSSLSYDAAVPPAARDLEHTVDRHLTQYQEQKESQDKAWRVAERTHAQGQGLRFVSATEMTSIAAHIALLTATKQGRMLLDHLAH